MGNRPAPQQPPAERAPLSNARLPGYDGPPPNQRERARDQRDVENAMFSDTRPKRAKVKSAVKRKWRKFGSAIKEGLYWWSGWPGRVEIHPEGIRLD